MTTHIDTPLQILQSQGKYQNQPPFPFVLGTELAGKIADNSPIPEGTQICRTRRKEKKLNRGRKDVPLNAVKGYLVARRDPMPTGYARIGCHWHLCLQI